MTKQLIIKRPVNAINQLPAHKAEEISDFVDFLMKQYGIIVCQKVSGS